MINNEKPSSLNAKVFLLWLKAVVIVRYKSEGVFYSMIVAIIRGVTVQKNVLRYITIYSFPYIFGKIQ